MLFCYRRPANIAWSLLGTGASFGSDIRLSNGHPGEPTAIEWLSEETPTTADYLDLIGQWATPRVIRVITIIGLNCGAGVKVEVTGRRAEDAGYDYALGGNSMTGVTTLLPDGRVCLTVVLAPGLDPLIGIQLRFYNDRTGSTWADNTTEFRIGELDVWAATELKGRPGWGTSHNDPTERMRTLDGGLHTHPLAAWRIMAIELSPETLESVRGLGLIGDQDWEMLSAAMLGDTRCALVVRYESERERQTTTVFGFAVFDARQHIELNIYQTKITVEEIR